MTNHNLDFLAIQHFFSQLNLNVEYPGFYNDQKFLEAERINPNSLDYYAVYVENRQYSSKYIAKVTNEIPKVMEYICSELERDGRLGACVDISGCLVKIFEELGIWAYCATGACKLTFKRELALKTTYFWPFNESNIIGHQWVVAPPYLVVDPTLKYQNYSGEHSLHLPRYVLATELEKAEFEFDDLVEPEIRFKFPKPHTVASLEKVAPLPLQRLKSMASCGEIQFENCKVHYGCVATRFWEEKSIMDCDGWGYKPNGKSPKALFMEIKKLLR